jgi:hypothetical protein
MIIVCQYIFIVIYDSKDPKIGNGRDIIRARYINIAKYLYEGQPPDYRFHKAQSKMPV